MGFGGYLGWGGASAPKTAYAGLQKSLQQEWDFMQRVTPYIGMALQVV